MRRICLVLVTASLASLAGCAYPDVGFEGDGDALDPAADGADTTLGDVDETGGGIDTGADTTLPPDTTIPPDTAVPLDTSPPDTTVPPDTKPPPDTYVPPDTTITLDTWVPLDVSFGDSSDGGYGGILCGSSKCVAGEECCLTPSGSTMVHSCTTAGGCGGVTLACDGPEDCPGTAKLCCMSAKFGSGTWPTCPGTPTGAACSSTCTSSFPFLCPGSGTGARCHTASDCTDSTTPFCCYYASLPEGPSCVSSLLKAYATTCY